MLIGIVFIYYNTTENINFAISTKLFHDIQSKLPKFYNEINTTHRQNLEELLISALEGHLPQLFVYNLTENKESNMLEWAKRVSKEKILKYN